MPDVDAIIIGSGLSGLHAAYPLIEDGRTVVMLDVGMDGSDALEKGSLQSFEEYRRYDPAQYKIFLGEDLSGIGASKKDTGHAGSMTSGRRSYVVAGAAKYLPIKTDVVITQSLARGGLSEAWGAVCDFFTDEELEAAGIPAEHMSGQYASVIERIGVSGAHPHYNLQAPARIDENHSAIVKKYRAKKHFAERYGFSVAQPLLALLTESRDGREQTKYRDMDFWDNVGRSVYRGHYTLEKLKTYSNFTYTPHMLVKKVEAGVGTAVTALDLRSGKEIIYKAETVILAAGAVNTTRILLKSFKLFRTPTPVIMKDNYLIPCLQIPRLGAKPDARRHSLCQLVMHGIHKNKTYVQLYSYSSLLLYKLLRYVPLPIPEAFSALSLIAPSIVLADVRFPSHEMPARYSQLLDDSVETLEIIYPQDAEEASQKKKAVAEVKRALRALGLLPLTSVRNPFGSTSHYAGGVPYTDDSSYPLRVNAQGQVHGAKNIFVADTATWRKLPAKPPALTIMANANRIGTHVRDYLRAQQ